MLFLIESARSNDSNQDIQTNANSESQILFGCALSKDQINSHRIHCPELDLNQSSFVGPILYVSRN